MPTLYTTLSPVPAFLFSSNMQVMQFKLLRHTVPSALTKLQGRPLTPCAPLLTSVEAVPAVAMLCRIQR